MAAASHPGFWLRGRGEPDIRGRISLKSGSPVELNTALIEAPKAGQAVVVDLVFGRTPGGGLFLQPNQHQLGHVLLSTGEEFFIIAGLVDDFDAQAFRQNHQPFAEDTEIGFLQEPPGVHPDDLRGAIMLPALRDGVLRIVEIGPAYVDEGDHHMTRG
jgi:hypothetical protein